MDPLINDGYVELNTAGLGANATSITLKSGHGARLPDPATVGAFTLVFFDSAEGNVGKAIHAGKAKRVRVTAISGDVLTVTDGAEGTSTSAMSTVNVGLFSTSKAFWEAMIFRVRYGGLSGSWYADSTLVPNTYRRIVGFNNLTLSPIGSGASNFPVGSIIRLHAAGSSGWVWVNGAAGAPSSNDRFRRVGDGLNSSGGISGSAGGSFNMETAGVSGIEFMATGEASGSGGYVWRQIG